MPSFIGGNIFGKFFKIEFEKSWKSPVRAANSSSFRLRIFRRISSLLDSNRGSERRCQWRSELCRTPGVGPRARARPAPSRGGGPAREPPSPHNTATVVFVFNERFFVIAALGSRPRRVIENNADYKEFIV